MILYQCSHLYSFWPFNKISWSLPIIRSYLVIFSYWFPKMSLIIPLIVRVPHLTLNTTCKEKLKNGKMVVVSRWRVFSLARVHPADKLLLLLLDPVLKVSNSMSKDKISFEPGLTSHVDCLWAYFTLCFWTFCILHSNVSERLYHQLWLSWSEQLFSFSISSLNTDSIKCCRTLIMKCVTFAGVLKYLFNDI